RIDLAVTEIPDPQLASLVTEARRREHDAPGRVEHAALGENLQRVTGKIECLHDAVPCARDIVMPVLILHRKRYEEFDVAVGEGYRNDVERRIALRRFIGERVHQRKSAIVDFHLSALEIGRIEERPAAYRVGGDRESFVDGALAVALALALIAIAPGGVVN